MGTSGGILFTWSHLVIEDGTSICRSPFRFKVPSQVGNCGILATDSPREVAVQVKTETKWYGWVILALIIGLVIYSQSSDKPVSQTNALQTTQDRRIQILHPQWDVAGKDGAITIITGFSESGQRIVASTDGEGTCGVGMSEGERARARINLMDESFQTRIQLF
jgi:hypothetical protein